MNRGYVSQNMEEVNYQMKELKKIYQNLEKPFEID